MSKSAPICPGDHGPSDSGTPFSEAAAPKPAFHPEQLACSFTEQGSVTLAVLLNLLRLMGAELVLKHAGGDTERFEQAVRAKIGQFTSPTANPDAREAGLAYAKHLVEQVVAQIRAQAQLQKSLSPAPRREVTPQAVAPAPHLPRLLN
jgi:hypothetical protein